MTSWRSSYPVKRDRPFRAFGLDPSSSPARPSAYAVLGEGPRVLECGTIHCDKDILEAVEVHQPSLIAIDAPLGLPRGLCCLEEDCPCQPLSPYKGREAERALARLGIGCFFTTKKTIIKALVCRALDLKRSLEKSGHPVVEVYPYATRVRLWGKSQPSKATPEGMAFLCQKLAFLVPGCEAALRDHHFCDALLAAYTAYLHYRGETEVLGVAEEGSIVIPGARA